MTMAIRSVVDNVEVILVAENGQNPGFHLKKASR